MKPYDAIKKAIQYLDLDIEGCRDDELVEELKEIKESLLTIIC
jgi:hypothetical protein